MHDFKAWLQTAMEDEPKQCFQMEKRALCKPEEQLTLQPKSCKRNTSLELFPSKPSHVTEQTSECSVVLSMQKESLQSLPNHEASHVFPVNKHYFGEQTRIIFPFIKQC